MVAKAIAKYVRISPFKARAVIALIKGMQAKKAIVVLKSVPKKAANLLEKVLKSAVANAKQKGYAEDALYISKLTADAGPMLKRFRAATFGRANPIQKRTSHILIELDSPEKITRTNKRK